MKYGSDAARRWATPRLVALALLVGGCGAAPSEPVAVSRVAEEPRCEELHLPIRFAFRCMRTCLAPEVARNAEVLDELVADLRERRALRQIRLVGYRSVGGAEGAYRYRYLPERRARSVAAALARRGFDPAMIVAAAADEEGEAAPEQTEPDRCPSPVDDDGHPSRRVEVTLVVCGP